VVGVVNSVTYPEPAGRSADFQSAVSQNSILQNRGRFGAPGRVQRPADYISAIQQIGNLRYGTVFASLGTYRTAPPGNAHLHAATLGHDALPFLAHRRDHERLGVQQTFVQCRECGLTELLVPFAGCQKRYRTTALQDASRFLAHRRAPALWRFGMQMCRQF
jgi:hypothetical protein